MSAKCSKHIDTGIDPYGKKFVFLIENLNEIVPKLRSQWGLGQEPDWESRTSSRTSLRIKNLIKNHDLRASLIEEILNEDFFLIKNTSHECQVFQTHRHRYRGGWLHGAVKLVPLCCIFNSFEVCRFIRSTALCTKGKVAWVFKPSP